MYLGATARDNCWRMSIGIGLKTTVADRDPNRQMEREGARVYEQKTPVTGAGETVRQDENKNDGWMDGEEKKKKRQDREEEAEGSL